MIATAYAKTDPATALGLPPDRTFHTTAEHLKVIADRTGVGVRVEEPWLVAAVDADGPHAAYWVARTAVAQ